MKIISKFKDYYDYLVGIYGEDPLLVFDRRENNPQFADLPHTVWRELPPPIRQEVAEFDFPTLTETALYVGNQRVYLFNTGERVYTSYDVAEIDYEHRKSHNKCVYCFLVLTFHDGKVFRIYDDSWYHALSDTDRWQAQMRVQMVNRQNKDIAAYSAVPLLLSYKAPTRNSQRIFAINPNLKALGVYLPEQWVWQEISAYLGQLRSEQETSPPVPDKNKIENKGFDVKHSFRPKMKK